MSYDQKRMLETIKCNIMDALRDEPELRKKDDDPDHVKAKRRLIIKICLNLMTTLQINKVLKILRKIYTRDLEMRIVVMSKLILQSCKRWSKSSEEEIEKEILDIFLTMVNLIFFVRGYDVMTQFNQVFINTIVLLMIMMLMVC